MSDLENLKRLASEAEITAVFKGWFDDMWIGGDEDTHEIPRPNTDGYKEYLSQYTLAHGAWRAAIRAYQFDSLIERVEKAEKDLLAWREGFYDRFLEYRNIGPEFCRKVCDGRDGCGGTGYKTYANTSTWRHGVGGQAMTVDVCDKCWGSGSSEKPWPSHRALAKGAQQ